MSFNLSEAARVGHLQRVQVPLLVCYKSMNSLYICWLVASSVCLSVGQLVSRSGSQVSPQISL